MTAARRTLRDSRKSDDARRVRDLLRSALNGDLYPNGLLPGETQLMEQFAVSRSSVRDALAMLHAEGLIDRRKGLGTLVVHSKNIVELNENHGVGEPGPGSIWSGLMRTHVLDWSDVPLPHIAADRMGAEPGEPSLRIDYVAMLDGTPLGVATNYLRYPQAAAVHPSMFKVDWYAMLDAAGLPVGETTFLWEAGLADEMDARLLGIEVGAAIMIGEQVIYEPSGVAYDFALTRGRGDRTAMFSRAGNNPA